MNHLPCHFVETIATKIPQIYLPQVDETHLPLSHTALFQTLPHPLLHRLRPLPITTLHPILPHSNIFSLVGIWIHSSVKKMNYMPCCETLNDNFLINIGGKLKVLLILDLLLINIGDIKKSKDRFLH